VARVPVFLFQAAQAALVPRLSHHAGGGRDAALRSETRALVLALAGVTVVASAGAAVLGPTVVRIGWGEDFALGSLDFAVLAAASCVYLMALTFASALIARQRPDRVTLGWAIGVAVLVTGVAIGGSTLARVEGGFLAGAIAAAIAMGLLARGPLAARDHTDGVASVPDPPPSRRYPRRPLIRRRVGLRPRPRAVELHTHGGQV
jgi:O-antigen/teichoic acid export membrane protein